MRTLTPVKAHETEQDVTRCTRQNEAKSNDYDRMNEARRNDYDRTNEARRNEVE